MSKVSGIVTIPDAFESSEGVGVIFARMKVARELEVIDGGDHSFKMLKSADIAPEQVHDQIIQKMAAWLKANL